MPELPEIAILARQMDEALPGRRITAVDVAQPKCLNRPLDEFRQLVTGAVIGRTARRGKWLCTSTDRGRLLINLGMGGGVYLLPEAAPPKKQRATLTLSAGELQLDFFWFGYLHFAPPGEAHPPTDKLGPDALELSAADFRALAAGSRSGVKSFLLDQSKLAGIGNAYVRDILHLARLHPLQSLNTLNPAALDRLHAAIHQGLEPWIETGGAYGEPDLYGRGTPRWKELMRVGYKPGQPCPDCGTPVTKIKTGSTASFICPKCQVL